MAAINLSYLVLLSMFAFAVCQGDLYPSRIRYKLISRGPAVSIGVEWGKGGNRWRRFTVDLCSAQKICTQAKMFHGLGAARFDDDGVSDLVFFNTYTIRIQVYGLNAVWKPWSSRSIFTGAGELSPLRGVVAAGGNENVTITWLKSPDGVPKVDRYVEIKVFHKSSSSYLETHRTSNALERYTIGRLSAGVEYTANVSVYTTFGGQTYRSQAVSIDFMTEPPEVREFPPVQGLEVRPRGDGKHVLLELTYRKPKAPGGAEFKGVRIDVVDRFKSKIVDGLEFKETKIEIDKLPYYAHFTVEVRALYDDVEDLVVSEEVSETIGTGPGVLPAKPRILEAMSINKTAALIRWSHDADKSVEFSYRIVLNDGITVDIGSSNANYTVMNNNLEPDRVYNVTFSALLAYDGELTEISSERKQFRMLPQDALVAKISVEDILGHLLHLNWSVTLPTGAPKCYISVNQCDAANRCTRTILSNMADPTVFLEVEPFERYNITMSTTCMFVPDIIVSGISEAMNVLAASRPPAVFGLSGDSPDENTLNIFWTAGPPYVEGYRISYRVLSGSSWEELELVSPSCTISGLESSTDYDVSVVPYSVNGNEKLAGPPTNGTFRTLDHVPPEVTDIIASQVNFTRTITVNWTAPPYDKGHLSFRVTTRCQDPQEIWTNETSLEFKTEEAPVYPPPRCEVSVQTFNPGSRRPTFSHAAHASPILRTLPPPLGAEAVFVADGEYRFKVTPPQVNGVKDFVYQASHNEEFDEFHGTDDFIVEEERFDTNVSYAVRVCVNDLCSQPCHFTFTTNTGRPGRVRHVGLEMIDSTRISVTWLKPINPNGPIDGYFVTITKSGDQKPVGTFKTTPTDTSLVFKADSEYTKYDVAVRAFNYDKLNRTVVKHGEDRVQSIETHGTVPRRPIEVKTAAVHGRKTIQWNSGADKEFDIKCFKIGATAVQTQEETILSRTDPVLELSDPLLTPYTQYVFRISSCVDAAGVKCGEPAVFRETTDVGYPSRPKVQLVSHISTQILLRWSRPTKPLGPIDGYELAYTKRTDGLSPKNWGSISINDRSAAIDNLEENTAYIFHVRAYNIDFGNKKLYSAVGVLNVDTEVARGSASTAVVAASVVTGVAGSAALGFVVYWKLGHVFFGNQ